jgi:Protein of unknown function (DUF3021).
MDQKNNYVGYFPGIHKFINSILYPFGLISTAALFFMSLFAEYTNIDADYKPALTLRNVAVVIAFCFIFALSNRIFANKKMSFGIKLLLHCLALTADFVAVGIFLSGYYSQGSSAVEVTAIFIAIYLIIMIPVTIIRYVLIKSKINHSKYKKQF